jgi:hypothetical protein
MLGVFVILAAGVPGCAESSEKACERIKALIPKAASVSSAEWASLSKAGSSLEIQEPKNQPLTLLLLVAPRSKDSQDAKLDEEIKFLAPERPAEFVDAITKSLSAGHVTCIQPEYITDFTCSVEGTTARGAVSFSAPKVYSAKVDYVARKANGAWQIDEFHFPKRGLSTKLGKDGLWQAAGLASPEKQPAR